jgi:curved DNA-binding protein
VKVSFAEAALGTSVIVPAPDGSKVRVKVPAGTQAGTVLYVRGKGAPRVKGTGNGDLKITIEVPVPTALNEGQRKALEDFVAASA